MAPRFFPVFILPAVLAAPVFGQGDDAAAILQRAVTAYQGLHTYEAEGKVISDIESGGRRMRVENTFSMRLKKPNLYLISWQGGIPVNHSGAVWNAGEQPYLFASFTNRYAKVHDDEMALASATGLSGGVAHTIPSLFFGLFDPRPFDRLTDPRLKETEAINGIECHVITSPSRASREETFWISREDYRIVKYTRSYEAPGEYEFIRELSDEEADLTLKAFGLEVSRENRERIKKRMRQAAEEQRKAEDLKGISTEIHLLISQPELTASDFKFYLPEGVTEQESLFDGVPGF